MSAVRLSRAVIPFMQKQKWGRIIHMTSHTIKHPIDNLMLSNSIRAAVVGLAKTQSFELGPQGILVNSVGPGVTDTDRIKQLFADRAKRNQTSIEQEYAAAAKSRKRVSRRAAKGARKMSGKNLKLTAKTRGAAAAARWRNWPAGITQY